jgi:hypothetical protein
MFSALQRQIPFLAIKFIRELPPIILIESPGECGFELWIGNVSVGRLGSLSQQDKTWNAERFICFCNSEDKRRPKDWLSSRRLIFAKLNRDSLSHCCNTCRRNNKQEITYSKTRPTTTCDELSSFSKPKLLFWRLSFGDLFEGMNQPCKQTKSCVGSSSVCLTFCWMMKRKRFSSQSGSRMKIDARARRSSVEVDE